MAKRLEKGLIVSCQALKEEPLYGGDTIAKMAKAALEGGCVGIRANTVRDINKIYKFIDGSVPIIGIIKSDYDNSPVYITPTLKEVKRLIASKCDVIALDATIRSHPAESVEEMVSYIRKNSDKKIMADISTIEEARLAEKMGFDYISSTLCGYTEYTRNTKIPNLDLLRKMKEEIRNSVIVAEGGIKEKIELEEILNLGIEYVVIGGAITRPKQITSFYVEAFNE